ncbi:dienelactone hydrolase family protein [bacterium]|nr:dienelactone hydrolase family protein [bacterium]
MKILFLFLLLLGVAGAELLKDESLSMDGGVKVRQWTYRSHQYGVKGLLFVPPTPAGVRRPVVIFSHDGINGISKEHRLSSLRLARAGYVVFAPSYRGEDGSEGMVEVAKGEVDDVLRASELLAEVPEADCQRLALAGASHGALISILAASRNPKVKAVVVAYGVMDIYRWWDYLNRSGKRGNDEVTRRTYGDGPESRPQSFAIRNALGVVPQVDCPVLVLQGKKDDIVPYEQAEFLQQAMQKAGKTCQVELYPDCLHGFLVYAPYLSDVTHAERQQTEQSWRTMLEFLRKNL